MNKPRYRAILFSGLLVTQFLLLNNRDYLLASQATLPAGLSSVSNLPLDEAANGLLVKVKGTLTYCDQSRGLLYLQDGTNAMLIRTPPVAAEARLNFHLGQIIEVDGATFRNRNQFGLNSKSIQIIGPGELPEPAEMTAKAPRPEEIESRYVRIKGWIPGISRMGNLLNLKLVVSPGHALDLAVNAADIPSARDWAGCLVEVSGVFTSQVDSTGKITGGRIYVNDETGVRKIESLPISSIGDLGATGKSAGTEPLRLRGTVVQHSLGEFVLVRDDSGRLRVPYAGLNYFNFGSMVEIFAFELKGNPEAALTNVSLRLVMPDTPNEEPTQAIITPSRANTNLGTLTTVAQIRRLSAQESSRGYPVHVTGVILLWEFSGYQHFVQDETSGIYLHIDQVKPLPELRAGQKIEIDGYTGPGSYAPTIISTKIHRVGNSVFPEPKRVTYREMVTGNFDSQWVLLKGVVRSQWTGTNFSVLTLFTGDGVIKVTIYEPLAKSIIDSVVEVRGVCTTVFDDRRRLQGVEVRVPNASHLQVEEHGPEDPFSLPVKAINDLFQYQVGRSALHRAHLMGVATLQLLDGSFFLQDGSAGIQVQPDQTAGRIPVGTTVEVVGFPLIADRTRLMQDAQVRSLRKETPVEIMELKPETSLDDVLHATLVRIQGQVRGHYSREAEEWLTLQFGSRVIDVILQNASSEDQLTDLEPGTVVRLTGVYSAQVDDVGKTLSFRLLLRSTNDVIIVSRPSWWKMHHTLWALFGGATALFLALTWVRSLRAQVRQRTRELAYERDLLKALLGNYPDAIYFKDLQSKFVRVSKSKLERSFALAKSQHRASPTNGEAELPEHLQSLEKFSDHIVGKSDFDLFAEERDRAAYEDEQAIIKSGTPLIGKVERAVLPDGQTYWSLSTKMPWRSPEGAVIGTFGISKDITSIKEAEIKMEALHRQLVETSRQAGMAEVATSVLHNVGNVLNSINVSTTILAEKVQQSRLSSLSKVVALMEEHTQDLGEFITQDPRGRMLPNYLKQLDHRLATERGEVQAELSCLAKNVEHIKHIVAMQQNYAKVSGLTERAEVADLVEDALRFNSGGLDRHHIEVSREMAAGLPAVVVDKHKVLQILVNLIRNAKYACDESRRIDKRLIVRAANGAGRVRISVIDNGVGVPVENLDRIFNFGFTTRKEGHGFGLHSGALAAKELGGALTVASDGPGHGATFTLELPVTPPKTS